MLEWVDMEEPGMERVPVSGVPVKLSASPGEVRHRAPRAGEHNDECYRDLLGYSPERIEALRTAGFI